MLKRARRRLVFDEFFLFIVQLRRCRQYSQEISNMWEMLETADTVRLLEKLPYKLTDSQKKVWEEIRADLQGT